MDGLDGTWMEGVIKLDGTPVLAMNGSRKVLHWRLLRCGMNWMKHFAMAWTEMGLLRIGDTVTWPAGC